MKTELKQLNPAEFYTKEEYTKLMTEFALYEIDGDKKQAVHHLVCELIDKYLMNIDYLSESEMSVRNIAAYVANVFIPRYNPAANIRIRKTIKFGIFNRIIMNISEMFAYRLQENQALSESTLGLSLFDKQGDFDDDRSAIIDRLIQLQFNDIYDTVDPLLQKLIGENLNIFTRTLFETELL